MVSFWISFKDLSSDTRADISLLRCSCGDNTSAFSAGVGMEPTVSVRSSDRDIPPASTGQLRKLQECANRIFVRTHFSEMCTRISKIMVSVEPRARLNVYAYFLEGPYFYGVARAVTNQNFIYFLGCGYVYRTFRFRQ
jgi:hypothetical protein